MQTCWTAIVLEAKILLKSRNELGWVVSLLCELTHRQLNMGKQRCLDSCHPESRNCISLSSVLYSWNEKKMYEEEEQRKCNSLVYDAKLTNWSNWALSKILYQPLRVFKFCLKVVSVQLSPLHIKNRCSIISTLNNTILTKLQLTIKRKPSDATTIQEHIMAH